MSREKNILAGLVFDKSKHAHELYDKLQQVDDENEDVEIIDAAFAHKSEDGKISLEQTGDITAEQGAVSGTVVGALAGAIVAGPIGLAAGLAGGSFGALYGLLRDTGVDDNYMRDLARKLEPGKTLLFILYSGAWAKTGDAVADALVATGVEHVYTTLPAEAIDAARQATIAAQQRQSEAQAEEAPLVEPAAGEIAPEGPGPSATAPDPESEQEDTPGQ